MRYDNGETEGRGRRRKIQVPAGKSVKLPDFESSSDEHSEDKENQEKHIISGSEIEISDTDSDQKINLALSHYTKIMKNSQKSTLDESDKLQEMDIPPANFRDDPVGDKPSECICYGVLKFMQKEAIVGPTICLNKVQERVAAACGISLTTVKRIAKEGKEVSDGLRSSFLITNTKRPNRKPLVRLNESELRILRDMLEKFDTSEKSLPPFRKVFEKFCADVGYRGSQSSFRKEVKLLGFRFKKIANKIATQKPETCKNVPSTTETTMPSSPQLYDIKFEA
ncbi:hypothetical protein RN001_008750 [Aquatica leii]|uniref:Uncharacterized protein n=1 Tax=Aquatica leii TaxID=1421715 RepID=A0AAN7SHE0_9COLE|nr:hypothetical protein RN001_008750 [Aquatica leii]